MPGAPARADAACTPRPLAASPPPPRASPFRARWQAVATETVETKADAAAAAAANGNGHGANGNGNGASSNGNGNGAVQYVPITLPANGAAAAYVNGNGAAAAPPANASVASAVGAAAIAAAAANGAAAGAANGRAPSNGAAAANGAAKRDRVLNTIDEDQNAVAAGKLELAAVTDGEPGATGSGGRSAAGTPYKNPGGRWSKFKTYSVWQRTFEIWTFAFSFAWKYAKLNQGWTYKGGKKGMTPEAVSARKQELAVWLREGLVKLGPTFIKVGQQFSTRVDVLAPEFVKELEKLQDNVPPFDSETALQILQTNLGAPPDMVFAEFNATPIAAASLGQVHLAKLDSGEKVVVKVQRPGLKELFDIDLKNIRALAVWLQKVDPKTDGAARDWVAIYDECSRILYQEIDYTLEGQNADLFRENFKDVDWVKVPKVYWQYTSPEVLVLEYAPGVKINDGAAIDRLGLDRNRLARLSVESYLQQILRHGFFHADPHPGNVAVDSENGGRLIYYDFGMMGKIPGDVRGGLMELFYGVYNRDADRCLEALITMGVLVPTGDRLAVRRTAQFFLTAFQERLDQQRKERAEKGSAYSEAFKPQRSKDEAKERRKAILSSIGEDLLLASNDQPFRFPATFTFVVRSFTVLDGIGKSLDPRFDITEISAPYARELLLEAKPQFAKWAEDLKKRSDNQNRAVANLFKGPNRIDAIGSVVDRLESGDLKLRVRALETERALSRVQAWQRVVSSALVASTLVNVGTVLSVSAVTTGATLSFAGAAVFGALMLGNYLKVAKLEKKEAQLGGAI
ncbi:MAG: ABC1 family-domain-containing protein [Monoraphidium minutum]|nr:MAG: ABC1 family-domain-containing protein [Monoraphidium minutum]